MNLFYEVYVSRGKTSSSCSSTYILANNTCYEKDTREDGRRNYFEAKEDRTIGKTGENDSSSEQRRRDIGLHLLPLEKGIRRLEY